MINVQASPTPKESDTSSPSFQGLNLRLTMLVLAGGVAGCRSPENPIIVDYARGYGPESSAIERRVIRDWIKEQAPREYLGGLVREIAAGRAADVSVNLETDRLPRAGFTLRSVNGSTAIALVPHLTTPNVDGGTLVLPSLFVLTPDPSKSYGISISSAPVVNVPVTR